MKLEYFINLDERGEFYSDVRDAATGETIVEFHREADEWDEDDEDVRDCNAVLRYLIDSCIVPKGSTIVRGN
jgi:hypothetical protein